MNDRIHELRTRLATLHTAAYQGDLVWTGPGQMTETPVLVLPKTKGEFINLVRSHAGGISKKYTTATLKRDGRDSVSLFVAERRGNQWVVTSSPGESSTIVFTNQGRDAHAVQVERGADMGFRQFLALVEKNGGTSSTRAQLFGPGEPKASLEATRFSTQEGWLLGGAEEILGRVLGMLGRGEWAKHALRLLDRLDLHGLSSIEIGEAILDHLDPDD